MTIFWVTLASSYFFAWFAKYFPSRFRVGSRFLLYPNIWLAVMSLLILVLVAGLRWGIGDTPTYTDEFINLGTHISDIRNGSDPGFSVVELLLKHITNDPQILIFTTALITSALIIFALYQYAVLFELAVFLYIATGAYIISMNGIRQYLAAAIIFVATRWLLAGKWWYYFLAVLLAASFHSTAIVFLPLYFLLRSTAWSWRTLLIMLGGALFFALFQESIPLLRSSLGDANISHFNADLTVSHGANIVRVIIAAVPVVMAFIGRRQLRQAWPQSDIIVNCSIFNFLFMLIGMKNWMFARFCIYFDLYNMILFPLLIKELFAEQIRPFIYGTCMVCYFSFFYYQWCIADNLFYMSNYLPH